LFGWIARYTDWLHTRWPAGTVEPLPESRADGATSIPGLWIAGDLTGVPLLKFALDGGARVVARIAAALGPSPGDAGELDLVIVGAGVAGMAAAVEARSRGLRFEILESAEPFATLVNFPRRKPIYTYPRAMTPAGALQVTADVKETLILELRDQIARAGIVPRAARVERIERRGARLHVQVADGEPLAARAVLVAIGRSGNHRRLAVPGEELDHVSNRLHDPRDFTGRRVVVVGGGDTAVETAIALVLGGADVTLVHRARELARPKRANLEKLAALIRDPAAPVAIENPTDEQASAAAGPLVAAGHAPGRLTLAPATRVTRITPAAVELATEGGAARELASDAVFTMIGREAPLGFFRRSGVAIAGEMTPTRWLGFGAFVLACVWLYDWKSGGFFSALWYRNRWFPTNLPALLAGAAPAMAGAAADPRTLLGTLAISASSPSFWYTLAYSLVIVIFGARRIRRRRTPYITVQTLTLMAIQVVPLFLLPEVILPLLGHHGLLPAGLADALFPAAGYGHGREYWRAYGFILAWPLNVYNLFTHEPLWAWIAIGFVQTCVLIPLGIWFFGKGVYCGWICSCGALAETLGDTHRHKMPHGPTWNRLNMAGQAILAIAVVLLIVRIVGWALPDGNAIDAMFDPVLKERYKWTVDVFLGGVVGYGTYFWYSGRVWCRFFCPLAAWMHIVARFTSFRILADKKKCISCNQCTSACHQGIDVMSFANKGLPMADPQCVRCSACVHACPTGVLAFGRVGRAGQIIGIDSLAASPVRMRERER
jgi:NosR/NirI family transcriptional regulator, nitrous oxide reductase regulator